MEILKAEVHVLQLDGYLNALRCVIGHPSKRFGAGLIEKKGRDISEIVEESIKNIALPEIKIRKHVVNFRYIQKTLNSLLYSKLSKENVELIDNIDWNLIEYYGLISTDEGESSNRLVSQYSHIIEYINKEKNTEGYSVIFFVEFDCFVIATYL